eukprot:3436224-Rhodomonas_salina.1
MNVGDRPESSSRHNHEEGSQGQGGPGEARHSVHLARVEGWILCPLGPLLKEFLAGEVDQLLRFSKVNFSCSMQKYSMQSRQRKTQKVEE